MKSKYDIGKWAEWDAAMSAHGGRVCEEREKEEREKEEREKLQAKSITERNIRVVVLALVALGLIVLARAAFGEVVHSGWMSLHPGDAPCFATVEVENRAGMYFGRETFVTEEGAVTLQYTTIGGHNPDDPDHVAVVALPDHVIADPMETGIADGGFASICLMVWQGA